MINLTKNYFQFSVARWQYPEWLRLVWRLLTKKWSRLVPKIPLMFYAATKTLQISLQFRFIKVSIRNFLLRLNTVSDTKLPDKTTLFPSPRWNACLRLTLKRVSWTLKVFKKDFPFFSLEIPYYAHQGQRQIHNHFQ